MDLLNRVSMIGNLVADPQVREVGEGKLVADFCLAFDPPGAKRDDSNRSTGEAIFVEVEVWDRMAENAGQYLSKGSPVLIEGRLKMDRWEDKETGKNRSKLKVAGDRMRFMPYGENRGGKEGGDREKGDREKSDRNEDRTAQPKREMAKD